MKSQQTLITDILKKKSCRQKVEISSSRLNKCINSATIILLINAETVSIIQYLQNKKDVKGNNDNNDKCNNEK